MCLVLKLTFTLNQNVELMVMNDMMDMMVMMDMAYWYGGDSTYLGHACTGNIEGVFC